jgi:hypothetical protein
MNKWTTDTANPPGKIQVGKINRALSDLRREHAMLEEKSGIIGKTEGFDQERSGYVGKWSIGGENKERPEVTTALEVIGTRYSYTVSRDNAAQIVADAEAALPALIASRPIEDNRITQEQHDQKEVEHAAIQRQAETQKSAKVAAFIAAYGSGEKITMQAGQMAIVAQLCFDNTDSQSDYFDSHAHLGPELALLVCPKGREDEATARRGLNRFLELARLGDWSWHTEKYSMGHGNYLSGPGVEVSPEVAAGRHYYRGGEITHGHWEIQFKGAYGDNTTLHTFKGYGTAMEAAPAQAAESVTVGAATLTENAAKGGIEIRFPGKPEASVLDALKSHGWRWSRFGACWYHRADDATRNWAKSFLVGAAPTEHLGPDYFDMQVENNMAADCGL